MKAHNLVRKQAYEDYANEVTSDGFTRIENITFGATGNGKNDRHIRTQLELAFRAGWRAALKE